MSNHTETQDELKLHMLGTTLRVCDTSMYFDSGLDLEVPSGLYLISELIDETGEPVGVELRNSEGDCCCELAGEVTFSFGQFGLFDKRQTDHCFGKIHEMNDYYSQLQSDAPRGKIYLPEGVEVPFFRCAEGAAVVFKLLREGSIIGVFIRFGYDDEFAD